MLNKVKQVKKDNGFKLLDLAVYGAILIIVSVLFVAVFTTRDTDPLSGIKISVSAQVVFEYEFGGVPKAGSDAVSFEEDDKGITVTVKTDDGDFNVIFIDKVAKTAKMIEANCKGKQCLYFGAIDNNSKFIYCNPHNLKIEPYAKDYDNPNIPF